jgi:3-methyladenine DNA glycosylase/8-oxoguanine DNA glycosylase
VERVRAMFDLNADWAAIGHNLGGDPFLAEPVGADPGIRVPGCWNGFELTVRAILGQQVTVKGATTLAGRMAASFGKPCDGPAGLTHLFPTPEALAQAPLANIGLTGARVETVRRLARAVCSGKIRFDGRLDSETILTRLREIPGIGPWTAQYVAMRALGEPDAFPSSDLGLLKAMALGASREAEIRSQGWRPWRAYAAMYLWRSLAQAASTPRVLPLINTI